MNRFEKGNRAGEAHHFRPGVSGNPGGRPKNMTTYARKVAKESVDGGEITKAEALVRKLYEVALGGNVEAIRLLLERQWPARKPGA